MLASAYFSDVDDKLPYVCIYLYSVDYKEVSPARPWSEPLSVFSLGSSVGSFPILEDALLNLTESVDIAVL